MAAVRAALWLLAAALPAQAQINVMSPSWLASKYVRGRIEGSTTTIGAPFYGERVLGQLVYAPPKSGSEPHCSSDDYDLPRPLTVDSTKYQGKKEVRLINIAVVRRGGCSFSTKVKVAAEKGAHAVIIVDNANFTRRQMRNVIVAEDSYDDDVHIPSIFVCKEDGNELIDAFQSGVAASKNPTPIVVELAWNVPTKSVVSVDQWMSSASRESLKFLREFAPKRRILNQVIRFQPHFTVFGMGNGGSAQTTSKLCTDSTGRFCAEDPDGDGPVSGKDVIEEDLRQLCLHEKSKVRGRSWTVESTVQPPEFAEKYWSYIEQFSDRCPLEDATDETKRFGAACSYSLMQEVGLSPDLIESVRQCANPVSNVQELERQKNHTAWSPRALRINGWRYSGILDAELVATAVCAGFAREPEECQLVKVKDRLPTMPYVPVIMRSDGVGLGTMFAWILVTAALIGSAFFLYKQYLKKEMRVTIREEVMLEVEAQMGEYGKLCG